MFIKILTSSTLLSLIITRNKITTTRVNINKSKNKITTINFSTLLVVVVVKSNFNNNNFNNNNQIITTITMNTANFTTIYGKINLLKKKLFTKWKKWVLSKISLLYSNNNSSNLMILSNSLNHLNKVNQIF